MPRLLYSLALYLLMPLVLARLLWRARRAPAYARRWGERLGFGPSLGRDRRVIWVHSVSVGETLAALPLIRELQRRYPEARLVVTTMTPTGSERVRAALGDSVHHVYAPYDLPGAVNRFLDRVHPDLLVIMETELWPNILAACQRRGIAVILANARLSARSAAGYRRLGPLTRGMMGQLAVVAAQTREDGERFLGLGLPAERLAVTGNIKFDFTIDDARRARAEALGREWRGPGRRSVWLVASTHRGEDGIVLDAFARVLEAHPRTLLVLVPRHPERFDEVARLCAERGHRVARRGAGQVPGEDQQVLLGDTMGELPDFFGACDLAFVGGSLVAVGGHNLIEPAAWGVPVLSGPSLHNFAEVASLLEAAGGMRVRGTAEDIAAEVVHLLADGAERRLLGERARAVAEANRGAMARLLAVIARWWVR
ncbi:MAG: lipid IV(A) 3-deoxy-D-manno-octulosonic acid transferase [Porticoccaceae bacterium]